MSYVFFPGCSLEGSAWDYRKSTLSVIKQLGLKLPEIQDWICCGSTPAHQTDPLLAVALPAKNLLAAQGKTVAVCCAACYSRLKTANHELERDPETRRRVAEVVGTDYDGTTRVMHLLEILVHDLGLARLGEAICQPLRGLKVVPYYGCLLSRPPDVTGFDDPENPTLMDRVLATAGAEVVQWPYKTECCGAGYGITDVSIVEELSLRILRMAKVAGASAIATACPLCQLNLDLRQRRIERECGETFGMPVFFFTQLLGLAMGLSKKSLGLRSLIVSPTELLANQGIAV